MQKIKAMPKRPRLVKTKVVERAEKVVEKVGDKEVETEYDDELEGLDPSTTSRSDVVAG